MITLKPNGAGNEQNSALALDAHPGRDQPTPQEKSHTLDSLFIFSALDHLDAVVLLRWPPGPDGGPDGDRFPTIYFRRTVTVADPAAFDSLTVRVRRDDGAVVYLNGAEVFRTNMPDGDIDFDTFADSSSTSETTYFEATFGLEDLVVGDNVIAVEVHQANADSSDLSMDLELIGVEQPSTGPATFVRGDTNRDGDIDISDPLRVLLFLFAGTAVDCLDALDTDDDGAVSLTDAIYELRYLFQGGPVMPAPFPDPGADPSDDALDCTP